MIKIDYKDSRPIVKPIEGKEMIFCIARRKWFVITPEEWVRQNILGYLSNSLNYPLSLIGVEKQISLGELKKRYDIVVYKNDKPFLVIECKEMNVNITEAVLSQVLRYNISLNAEYFFITNGVSCFGFRKNDMGFEEADAFPVY